MQGFAWTGLMVTLLFTLGYWRYSALDLERSYEERFRQLAERQMLALADRIHDYERVLLGARALFAASEVVDRDEWRRYVESLDLGASLPGIQGTGFAVVVPREERAAHEQALRAEGFADFCV